MVIQYILERQVKNQYSELQNQTLQTNLQTDIRCTISTLEDKKILLLFPLKQETVDY